MSSRIRRPSASTSASTPRGQGSRNRITDESPRSESGTPMFDDDEEGIRKRSTRGRNPLPPSSGPLFPPLPPKIPKSRISGNSFGADLEPALDMSPTQSEKPDLPAATDASLTPPPPGSEDVLLDDEEEAQEDDEEGTETGDGKESVKPEIEVEEATDAEVKEGELVRNGSERAGSHSRAKRRRGEEALLLDDHLLPPEIRNISQQSTSRRSSNAKGDMEEEKRKKELPVEDVVIEDTAVEGEDEIGDVDQEGEEGEGEGDEYDEDGGQDITRCICQTDDPDNTSMMISCDKCNVWQHGPCMGIWGDDDAPDEYFCELCRPDLHGPLKRWVRRCGRDIAMFVPPTYDDLRSMRPHGDKSAPSQSTIFTDPGRNPSPSPPPPAKPASRSHHKKEVDPPVPAQEGRRTGRRLPFPERPASQSRDPQPAPKPPALAKRKSSAGGVESVSPNRSLSPSAHMHSAARRRITMNSRDAQYEEEVKAAMEASRREALGLSPAAETAPEVAVEEEEEKAEPKKGKRKRDDEEVEMGPNGKAKHPNQYTYRPKPPSSSQQTAAPAAPSPARRGAGGGTPAPPSIAPPQHEHGTRRAGAIAHGAIANPTLSATSVANLNWYLPDHLAAYTELLPTPQPHALDVRSQRTLPHISRNHHANQRYGPFSNDRDENGRLVLPDEIPMREPAGEAETHLEPPARVRYPAKRITVGEIRKRVRSMMDYVSKAQTGEEKRRERDQILGIVVTPLPKKGKGKEKADQNESEEHGANGDSMDIDEPSGSGPGAREVLGDIDMNLPDSEAEPPSPPPRTAAELMEELTRDLIAFQETYLSNTSATPLPPPISNFEPSLPVPEMDSEVDHEPVPEAEPEAETQAEPEADVEAGADVQAGDVADAQDSAEVDAANERQVQADGLEALVSDEVGMILDHPEPDPAHEPPSTTSHEHQVDSEDKGEATEIPASSFEIPTTEAEPQAEPVPEVESTSIIIDPGTHPTIDDFEQPQNQDHENTQLDSSDIAIGETEGLDVYREGEVDKVIVSGPEEVDVVESPAEPFGDDVVLDEPMEVSEEHQGELEVLDAQDMGPVEGEGEVEGKFEGEIEGKVEEEVEEEVEVEKGDESGPNAVVTDLSMNGDPAVTPAVVEPVV